MVIYHNQVARIPLGVDSWECQIKSEFLVKGVVNTIINDRECQHVTGSRPDGPTFVQLLGLTL